MSEEAHAERQEGIKRRIVAWRHESGKEEAKMVTLVIHRLSYKLVWISSISEEVTLKYLPKEKMKEINW